MPHHPLGHQAMLFNQPNFRNIKKLVFSSESSILSLLCKQPPACIYTQKHNYVDVYMKWKKDSYYDSIEYIHRSIELKPLISLKNCIAASPKGCIPISAISKRGLELGVPIKVARFLRLFPSIFEEFTGPEHDLPWFRLTLKAIELDREELAIYRDYKEDLQTRLKKLIMMSVENRLPLKIIREMQWYLGIPDEYLRDPEGNLDGSFRIVEMDDGLKGLAVDIGEKRDVVSLIQKNALKRGVYRGEPMEAIAFPLFPSKGLRLKRKISDWFDEFQKLPYISPYEDYSGLRRDSDGSEKRVVGVLHELLSLFVEHAAERKSFLCLRKYLGLPQKVHKVFERHLFIFYLSLRNKTCTAILKEPYCNNLAIEVHPLLEVRKKYIDLMKESDVILKDKRLKNGSAAHHGNENLKLDLDCVDNYMAAAEEVSL